MIGKTVAHYEILEKIGEGGMGEVYRARDTKLGRSVAVKILPGDFSHDPERVARFEREARTLASLHHPNVASIFGLEEADGFRFLVMEFVAGEDLSERLKRGPVPLEEALAVARHVAEGLERAHESGIIHRDLKPANIVLSSDGQAKILDFGLARAFVDDADAADPSKSPTLTAAMTHAGVIIGTAAYMSPEQARGRPVDKRADIWSFGVILYEMLTGRRLFAGETVSDTLAAVLTTEIDWDELPARTPPRVRRVLQRCLERDPKERLRDVGEARIAVGRAMDDPSDGDDGAYARPPRPGMDRRAMVLWPVSLLIVGLVGLWAGRTVTRPGPPSTVTREFEIPVDGLVHGVGETTRLSPDGLHIVFQKSEGLWIRRLDEVEAQAVPETQGVEAVTWSPDGKSLAYFADDRIWRYDLGSGGRTRLCDVPLSLEIGSGIEWGPGDRLIIASGNSGLYEVSARGGDPKLVVARAEHATEHFHIASFLPGGELVYAVHGGRGLDTFEVLTKGERKVIFRVPGGRIDAPTWSPTGHLLYRRGNDNEGIWALPFSLSRLEATGEPFLVVPNGGAFSVASDGSLLYFLAVEQSPNQVVWVDESGAVQEVLGEQTGVWDASLSPDGTRIALSAIEGDNRDIWIWDIEQNVRRRLTYDQGSDTDPLWMPDGKRILYLHWGDDGVIRTVAADGSGEPTDLFPATSFSLSSDGAWMACTRWDDETLRDVWGADARTGSEPFPVVQTAADELSPAISPDGSLVAYRSHESGRSEILLRRFPSGEGRWQVSTTGGSVPFWSPAGDRLFFHTQDHLASVAVTSPSPGSISLASPEPVYEFAQGPWTAADYDPTGRRFLATVVKPGAETISHPLRYVENWFAEFRAEDSRR